ncbi:CPBP family intramembrane glutamic endopeptidase [Caballeronia sp. Lep1P3]|uniref:CPBP family intramembrane glutamic endopeptidase n=1 Tax=Caballeronia sp. Lep1P3 TaxID=2878150 RepID=UPI001FD47EDF|nr:CPBP family intramembrane glutamic endopeptidase [Caballeronia sp. Lep1P3]
MIVLWTGQTLVMAVALWLGAFGVHMFVNRRQHDFACIEHWRWPALRAGAPRVLLRFAMLGTLVAVAVWRIEPESFLALPREKPALWLLIVVLYPALSVWPQELLYRSFLFHRYRALFGDRCGYVVTSALAFGYAHLIFLNWVAPAMTVFGGALFALGYRKHRSLALSCIEHALYGWLVFTVGLDRYFLAGAAWGH